jgi:hypothetical protein
VNRVEQVENRVSGMEDKVQELVQIVNDHERMLRKYEWNIQDIWDTMKRPKLWIMGVEEREEIQTKGTDNPFDRIIRKKFPNIKKDRVTEGQEAYGAQSQQDKYRNNSDTSLSKHSAQRRKKEF